ncbi:MAG TPA: SpoIIE family protein phosphatase [Gemmata sp.]|nr:SpoIIE family protein phosphatase [Gemmata sp.]
MPEPFLRVRQFMQPDPIMVEPSLTVREVLSAMNSRRIGAVVVATPDRSLVGIFTERDLLKRVAGADAGWREYPVSKWMTRNPHTIGPDLGWEDVTILMDQLRVRHLPVIENGRVIGIVTSRMLMSHRTEYLNLQIEERTSALRQANDELMARDADLRYNLRSAGTFQTRLLLPHSPPDWPELRWGIHFAPLDHLGGDYYDLAHPDPEHLGFLIADASGHSIAAAMVAILSRIAFADIVGSTTSPGEVLTAMNTRLQGLADERFVTAFYAVLNRRTRILTYANAGHPYPIRRIAGTGQSQPLSAQGFMLGIMPGEVYREKTIQLTEGDRICFYTDGLIETRNEIGENFGTERLVGCMDTYGKGSAEELTHHILRCQHEFRGTQQLTDDVTLVVTELCGQE